MLKLIKILNTRFFHFLIVVLLIGCSSQKNVKINGVSFVASPEHVEQKNIDPVLKIHANYAAVMPFGFIKNAAHPSIIYNTERQWFGETDKGVIQYIEMLHKNNIKVMVKPQLWISHGVFTGFLKMNSEENWKLLEASYRSFILDFAQIAEEKNVSMFCIGTELEQFITHRPKFWKALILEIKTIYKGKLTYAANWDEYKQVAFWKDLDYIGVDAYFPISDSKTPGLKESRNNWQSWKKEMQRLSETNNKKIIFTEYGYRSVDFAGKKPWVSDHTLTNVNLEAQTNATKALFQEIWNEDWFAGGFVWKWFINHQEVGGIDDFLFTPQNKPVEEVIKKYYLKFN